MDRCWTLKPGEEGQIVTSLPFLDVQGSFWNKQSCECMCRDAGLCVCVWRVVSKSNCNRAAHSQPVGATLLSFLHRISFNKHTCLMRPEVTSAVERIHMSCFLPPELWILSSLHFRPGLVINLNPSSYFDVWVCWDWTWMELDEYCLCCAGPDRFASQTAASLVFLQLWSAAWRWRDYRSQLWSSLISLFSPLISSRNKSMHKSH